jgi:hypothetical protein
MIPLKYFQWQVPMHTSHYFFANYLVLHDDRICIRHTLQHVAAQLPGNLCITNKKKYGVAILPRRTETHTSEYPYS